MPAPAGVLSICISGWSLAPRAEMRTACRCLPACLQAPTCLTAFRPACLAARVHALACYSRLHDMRHKPCLAAVQQAGEQ